MDVPAGLPAPHHGSRKLLVHANMNGFRPWYLPPTSTLRWHPNTMPPRRLPHTRAARVSAAQLLQGNLRIGRGRSNGYGATCHHLLHLGHNSGILEKYCTCSTQYYSMGKTRRKLRAKKVTGCCASFFVWRNHTPQARRQTKRMLCFP